MHLEASYSGKNSFWRYIVMVAVVFLVIQVIGGIPLIIYLLKEIMANPDMANNMKVNNIDFGPYGLEMNLFPFLVGLLGLMVFMKPLHDRPFMSVVNGGVAFRWKKFFIGYGVWLVLSAIYLVISLLLFPEQYVLSNISKTLIHLIVVSLVLIPFQAGFEEVLLRGYFMQGFTTLAHNRWIPLVSTATIFALMHGFNPEVDAYGFFTAMPQYLAFGLLFGIMTIMDDGIECSIGTHAANNTFLCIMVTNKDSALQTPAVFEQVVVQPWMEFGLMLIMCAIALLVFKKILHWDNWSLLTKKV